MVGLLQAGGFPVTVSLDQADVVVVNTCAFIRPAVEEAEATIRQVLDRKAAGMVKKVIVTGCLPQRFPQSLPDRFPEVDGFLGVGAFPEIARILGRSRKRVNRIPPPTLLPDHRFPRVISTPGFRAYLKVSEGCSNRCTYCLIPSLRGELRSRPIGSILQEAERLAEQGVREISLIAQDTTAYGRDRGDGSSLEQLLARLVRVEEIRWIRILYTHPRRVTRRLVEMIKEEKAIVPYLDMPIQHVSDRILRSMGRRITGDTIRRRIGMIRELVPDCAVRTTVMVGFPGETGREFRELREFISEMEFDHLGVFRYCPEPGTKAASFPSPVSDRITERRFREIAALQAGISHRRNRARIGKVYEVLIEGRAPGGKLVIGRIPHQAPEVDGVTRIQRTARRPGEFLRVRIVGADTYDLVGEPVTSRVAGTNGPPGYARRGSWKSDGCHRSGKRRK